MSHVTMVLSLIAGLFYILFSHFDLLRKIPGFYCEGFGCLGIGIAYFAIALVIIPVTIGFVGFLLAKESRLKQARISFIVSLAIMALSVCLTRFWNNIDIKNAVDLAKGTESTLYQELGIPLTQLQQQHPLLDNKRPLTITNQMNNTSVPAKFPLLVQTYSREDAVPSDNTLQAKVWIFVPESTERKIIATGVLMPTQQRSPDGRMIFEGTLSSDNYFSATDGFLIVVGKDGVTDSIDISLENTKKSVEKGEQ